MGWNRRNKAVKIRLVFHKTSAKRKKSEAIFDAGKTERRGNEKIVAASSRLFSVHKMPFDEPDVGRFVGKLAAFENL